ALASKFAFLAQSAAATPNGPATTVNVTFNTTPQGRQLVVDNVSYTAPFTLSWTIGTPHQLDVSSPQWAPAPNAQYRWVDWSDTGARLHQVIAPAVDSTYNADFIIQYLLTTNVSPSGTGSITAPAGDGYYDSGTAVLIQGTANAPYSLLGFTGGL